MSEWDDKLAKLERAIDGNDDVVERDEPEPPVESQGRRVLRWAVIGVAAGAGLVIGYYLLQWLIPLIVLAGASYGAYWYFQRKNKSDDD